MIANKKGFMFVETIVMCAALMLGLLIIYNSYTSSIAREKRRVNYNTIEGQYKLIAIKQYLQGLEEDWKCTKSGSSFNCPKVETLLSGGKNYEDLSDDLPEYLKDMYDIRYIKDDGSGNALYNEIFLVKCNETGDNTLYKYINETDKNYDFAQYLKTIKSCDDTSKYRFISEFYDEETKTYSYAWVEYPIINEEEEA